VWTVSWLVVSAGGCSRSVGRHWCGMSVPVQGILDRTGLLLCVSGMRGLSVCWLDGVHPLPPSGHSTSYWPCHNAFEYKYTHTSQPESFFLHLSMKMEPIESSETSAFKTQTLGKYSKENILHCCRSLEQYKTGTLEHPKATKEPPAGTKPTITDTVCTKKLLYIFVFKLSPI
jgi:hypothetical protein